jgi:hypothetical protein
MRILRTLLIHGARSAIVAAQHKVDNTNGWLTKSAYAPAPEYRRGGISQQERPHRMGATRSRPGV